MRLYRTPRSSKVLPTFPFDELLLCTHLLDYLRTIGECLGFSVQQVIILDAKSVKKYVDSADLPCCYEVGVGVTGFALSAVSKALGGDREQL